MALEPLLAPCASCQEQCDQPVQGAAAMDMYYSSSWAKITLCEHVHENTHHSSGLFGTALRQICTVGNCTTCANSQPVAAQTVALLRVQLETSLAVAVTVNACCLHHA
jgi:hypothetical protein